LVGDYWKTIKDQPELNLPSLRILLATYECDKLKIKVYEEYKADMTTLSEKIGLSKCMTKDQKENLKGILSGANRDYIERAQDYDKDTSNKFRHELLKDIWQ
jgi:hypothetical protein